MPKPRTPVPKLGGRVPEPWSPDQIDPFEIDRSLVLIGPNGAGKTRLAIWLDDKPVQVVEAALADQPGGASEAQVRIHRIPAQRSLMCGGNVSRESADRARRQFLCGDTGASEDDTSRRWRPSRMEISDFDLALRYLYAIRAKQLFDRDELEKRDGVPRRRKDTPVDELQTLWNRAMPHRRIWCGEDTISAEEPGGGRYRVADLSDGERATLYMAACCLCARDNAVVLVDEPEVNLHRSVSAAFWDTVESTRGDCAFIYITHDVEFACSRKGARIIWVKEYDYHRNSWDWAEIPAEPDLPLDLKLTLLGSPRRAVLVEGGPGGLDAAVYGAVFGDAMVVPVGSCAEVERITRVVNEEKWLAAGFQAIGVRDRDRLRGVQIAALEAKQVRVLPTADVESLLCAEPVVRAVASELGQDSDEAAREAKAFVVREIRRSLPLYARMQAADEIRFRLDQFDPGRTPEQAAASFKTEVASIDVHRIHTECLAECEQTLEDDDYECILARFSCKLAKIADRLSEVLDLKNRTYVKHVRNLLEAGRPQVVAAVCKAMGSAARCDGREPAGHGGHRSE
jgi:hypothetical protein